MSRSATKLKQAAIVRTIGSRFREARELSNMTQQDAAEALGYSNGSKLAKIEGASDTNSVPIYLIPEAARLYDVSTDFLFGLTDDWDHDGEGIEDRESFGYLMAMQNGHRKVIKGNFARLGRQMRAVSSVVLSLAPVVELITRGVARAKTDPGFDEMKGSAAVESGAERLGGVYKAAVIAFKKSKLDMGAWKEDPKRGFPELIVELALMDEVDRHVSTRAAAKVYGLPVSIIRTMVERECRARCLRDGKDAQMALEV